MKTAYLILSGLPEIVICLSPENFKNKTSNLFLAIVTKTTYPNVNIHVILTPLTIYKVKSFFTLPINAFPNKPWFLGVCSTDLLKTLWEKEKLLVTSNFSFSHSVFYLF